MALLSASVLVGVMAHSGSAGADPVADKRAQAAQIAAQLDSANRRIDQFSEQFNAARLHRQQVQGQLGAAKAGLARTDRQAQVIRARLAGVAIGAYVRSGQPLSVQISSGTGMALATVGRTYQDLAAGDQRELLDAAKALRARLAADRAELEIANRDAQAAEAKVAAAQRAAQGAVDTQQALLSQANGQLATLVAEAEAQRQAQQVAQVTADLASRAPQVASRAGPAAPAGPRIVRAAPSPQPSPGPGPAPAPPPSARAGTAVSTAQAQLGKPYQWGGAGPGSFDCSGLTMYSWAAAGGHLQHSTGSQYAATTHIPLSALQPGDLVFFYSDLSHVGIYVGNGMMIHAPHTGTVVSYASIYAMGTSAIFAGRVS